MELTLTLSERFKITPFKLYKQDCFEVIALINHFIAKADDVDEKPQHKFNADGFWN